MQNTTVLNVMTIPLCDTMTNERQVTMTDQLEMVVQFIIIGQLCTLIISIVLIDKTYPTIKKKITSTFMIMIYFFIAMSKKIVISTTLFVLHFLTYCLTKTNGLVMYIMSILQTAIKIVRCAEEQPSIQSDHSATTDQANDGVPLVSTSQISDDQANGDQANGSISQANGDQANGDQANGSISTSLVPSAPSAPSAPLTSTHDTDAPPPSYAETRGAKRVKQTKRAEAMRAEAKQIEAELIEEVQLSDLTKYFLLCEDLFKWNGSFSACMPLDVEWRPSSDQIIVKLRGEIFVWNNEITGYKLSTQQHLTIDYLDELKKKYFNFYNWLIWPTERLEWVEILNTDYCRNKILTDASISENFYKQIQEQDLTTPTKYIDYYINAMTGGRWTFSLTPRLFDCVMTYYQMHVPGDYLIVNMFGYILSQHQDYKDIFSSEMWTEKLEKYLLKPTSTKKQSTKKSWVKRLMSIGF